MGIFSLIFYFIIATFIYGALLLIKRRRIISKTESFTISILLFVILSGLCKRMFIPYTGDIFLSFVFLFIIEVMIDSYVLGKDFFDKNERNISYYIFLIITGFIINVELINKVEDVFLTGESLKIVLWFLFILFIYQYMKKYEILEDKNNNIENQRMSKDSIIYQYAKLKSQYIEELDFSDKELSNILFSIMIFENNRRSKILRDMDYFIFRLNGNKRKLGIMQVETSKFITDMESIELVYKKLEKMKTAKSKSKKSITDIIKSYCKDDYEFVSYIYEIVSKI